MSLVIFDFDGTIADSFVKVLEFIEAEAKLPQPLTKQEREQYRETSMKDMALRLGIPVWRLPQLYFKGRRVMRGQVMQVKPFAGMTQAIEALHKNGHKLCIVSANSAKNVRRALKNYGIDEYFVTVKGGAGILGKVTPIKQLCRRYKTKPAAAWYVGDEVQDIASAKAAGVKSLAVTWGFADPDKLSLFEPDAIAQTPQEIVTQIS